MKPYTVAYFIEKFSAIPEKYWSVGLGHAKYGTACALEHCGSTTSPSTPEAKALYKIIYKALRIPVWIINDCKSAHNPSVADYGPIYELGDTPKKRILAALELAKAGIKL